MENSLKGFLRSFVRAALSKVLGMISITSFVISFFFFTGITGSVVGLSKNNIYALISLATGLLSGMGWSVLRRN